MKRDDPRTGAASATVAASPGAQALPASDIAASDTSPRAALLAGARDTVPMMVGAMPFGVIFGVVALNAGLSPAAVMGMSLFVFAGSAQFIGAGLAGQGVALPLIVLTTALVNLRHALYAASLAPYLKHLPQRWLALLGFWLTDETFAVVARRFSVHGSRPLGHWYQLGSSVAMYLNWQIWTLVGVVAGRRLEGVGGLGLEFAMVVTFIGIVVPMIIGRAMFAAAIVAGVVALAARDMPHQLGLMLASLAGIVAGVIVEWRTPDPAAADTP